mmetsp:Transcript_85006/g.133763  ORF Transcript_85006/g.133763 Transcript_85006/m.133763 type:complete len:626 (-) Transcript_85006:153-2030(-)
MVRPVVNSYSVEAYLVPHPTQGGSNVVAVVCDNPTLAAFQSAANWMQEALSLTNVQNPELFLERSTGQLDEREGWEAAFLQELSIIDCLNGTPQWRCFMVVLVSEGPLRGTCAVGIGSNQKHMSRASNLALALTPEVAEKGPPPTVGICGETVAHMPHEDEAPLIPCGTDLENAKRRLVDYRYDKPDLSLEQHEALKQLVKGNPHGRQRAIDAFGAAGSQLVADLCVVLEQDIWKDNSSSGAIWVAEWRKWQGTLFSNLDARLNQSHESLGKPAKRSTNWRWYFGCAAPSTALDPTMTVERGGSPSRVSGSGTKSREGESNLSSSPCQVIQTESEDIPMRPKTVAQAWLDGIAPEKPSMEDIPLMANAQVAKSLEESIKDEERDRVIAGLSSGYVHESLTIRTLSSADTIPLGTDLDPVNGYNNLWAASKVENPGSKTLVRCNLGCRVIDGENVGFSYGQEVEKKSEHWSFEGVRKAMCHFRETKTHIIVVTKRREMLQTQREGVEIIIGERTDDVMVIKQAHKLNCPIVSRDGFKKWKEDPRLSPELRQWLRDTEFLQVRFSWSPQGEFIPDFDLPTPVLRPSASTDRAWPCDWCKNAIAATDGSYAQWNRTWYWLCRVCHNWQ